jgi:hypothetical protein
MAYTAETAQVRAAQLKEGLAWSQNLMKEFNSALDSYSGHLTDLKMAVAGVAQRTQVSTTSLPAVLCMGSQQLSVLALCSCALRSCQLASAAGAGWAFMLAAQC